MSKKENKLSVFVERIMSKNNLLTVRYKDASFSPKVMQTLEELRNGKEVNYKSLTSLERNNVGLCYWYGHFLPLNYQEAVKWYLAAEGKKGCNRAEFNLYVCYKRGTGVEVNMDVPSIGQSEHAIKYLDTQTITDFEKRIGTKVEMKLSKRGIKYASFMINSEERTATISKNAGTLELKNLVISFCENQQKERFFFIHRPFGKSVTGKQKPCPSMTLDEIFAKLCETDFDLTIL